VRFTIIIRIIRRVGSVHHAEYEGGSDVQGHSDEKGTEEAEEEAVMNA
jgi:hypothetical protein